MITWRVYPGNQAAAHIRLWQCGRTIKVAWFELNWDCRIDFGIDFEMEDAVQKLCGLDLVGVSAAGLVAVDSRDAIRLLDQRWDNYFVPAN